jgi:FixJ family two-component response regulator
LNGLDLQARVAKERVEMPIIFVTGYRDVPMTVRAMKAGAVEFLTKPFDDIALLGAVASALNRSRETIDQQATLRTLWERHQTLSQRECQVLAMAVAGRMNKQIAWELGISETTVKAHRGRVMQKMRAGSLAELVKMGRELDLATTVCIYRLTSRQNRDTKVAPGFGDRF